MSDQKNNVVKSYLKKYFIDAMGGMAQGLFASLLIGTILGTLGGYIPVVDIKEFFAMIASVAKNDYVVGAAIGIGMARGENKAEAVKRLLSGEVTIDFPASALHNHADVVVVIDDAACKLID